MHPPARAITLPKRRLSKPAASAFLLGFGLAIGHAQEREGFVVDLEWGAAWQGRNVVQSPNDDSGTRFALDRLTGDGPASAPRVQLGWTIAPRHELRFVFAPLRLSGSGGLEGPVAFEGVAFAAGPAEARYRFDSYRATWRYTVHASGSTVVKAGVTGKLRDAEITLRQGGVTATRSDTGFVPLLHLYAETGLGERTRLARASHPSQPAPGTPVVTR